MENATYEKIKNSGKLPSPSGVALELMRLVDSEDSTLEQISATVESDPALSGRVIKLVNSSLYGTPRTIASVSTAVKLLGRNTVKNLALGLSLLAAHRKGVSTKFDFERFWSESVARAVAARGLVSQFGGCAPDEAFTVGLLSKVGRIALATALPGEYDDLLGQTVSSSLPIILDAERKAFQSDHNELTALMMADWGIADVFCESVICQDNLEEMGSENDARPVRIAKTLHLAGAMAGILVEPKIYREDLLGLLDTARTFGVDTDLVNQAFDAAAEEWRSLGDVLSVQTQKAPSLHEAHTRASKTQQRILVVDDDPCILKLLTRYLGDAGYDVQTAANGAEALRILNSDGCPLVITDWMMPELDGLQLCNAIRTSETIGFVYIIMLTAQSDEESLAKAFDAGADDFLTKPFRKQELLARLKAGIRALSSELKLSSQQLAIHKTNAELATMNDKLQRIATTDELTGLYNRREAMRRLEEHWSLAERENRQLACMMIDIDHFKQCNDTYGHDTGDTILRETAHALKHCARANEVVFRIGGEEFVVLCPGSTAKEASVGAERYRAAVEANQIESGGTTLSVTISVGIAERNDRTKKTDDLLKLADEAMYEAKRRGRNRCCVSGASVTDVSPGSTLEHMDKGMDMGMGKTVADELACSGETRGTVLVVDDDPHSRRLARRLLERDGYDVHEACNGLDALTKVASTRPHVILMDIDMPDSDGLECTRTLKENATNCDIPIIIISGESDSQYVRASLKAGAQEYMTKPYQRDEFLLRVRAMRQLYLRNSELIQSNTVRAEQARAMGILFDLSRSLAAAENPDDIAALTVSATVTLMNSCRVSLMLPEESGKYLFVARSIGIDDKLASRIRVPLGNSISGRVFSSGKPTVFNTLDEGHDCSSRYESGVFASVPLTSRALVVPNKVVGVLNVTERHDQLPFLSHELEYLDLVCNMAAAALEQHKSGLAREHAHAAIVIGLAKLAEHRDTDTGKHLERVTQFALLLASDLRKSIKYASIIDDHFLQRLQQSMPLHDIGKVAISDAILLKPGPLTDIEFTAMKRHTLVGAQAIQSMIDHAPEVGFLEMAHDIALNHHERFDGSGYPRGLASDDIPFTARIAAVADVYDALTTERPYKAAMSHEKAASIIRKSSGSHFDPTVVTAFLNVETQCADLAARLRDGDPDARDTKPTPALAACST